MFHYNKRYDYEAGTWLDCEELSYPSGTIYGGRRRARARLQTPDGKLLTVRIGIADTYFTIPAVTQERRRRRGFVHIVDGVVVFHTNEGEVR